MRLEINARVEMGELFGGSFQWPLGCELALSKQYFLLYVNLAAGDEPLDILKLLNQAFACGLPEGFLLVPQAGFFTYAATEAVSAPQNLAEVFPQAPLPAVISGQSYPLAGAACFWLTLDLPQFSLFNRLIEIGYDQGRELSLLALIASGPGEPGQAFRQAVFAAALPDIRLFNLFGFTGLKLEYCLGQTGSFSLAGNLHLYLFGGDYVFSGRLAVNDRELKAALVSEQGVSIPKLFGEAMPGISFTNLGFGIDHAFAAAPVPARTLTWLQGRVSFGALDLSGELYLEGVKPLLARVLVNQDLSVAALFNQCIRGYRWPDQLFDITFLAGSQIYYRDAQASGNLPVPAALDYQPDFNIYAKLKLTLFYDFYVEGHIRIAENGVKATIMLGQPIDLYVIKLSGKNGVSGPSFGLSTIGGAAMAFSCGLYFFQSYCGDVEILCGKDARGGLRVAGSLTLSSDLRSVLGSQGRLQLSYSKNDGLAVEGWQAFDFFHDAAEFIDKLRKFINSVGSSGCGDIVGLICKDFLQGKFKVTPSFDTGSSQMYLVLNGAYVFTVSGEDFLTLDFPKLARVSLPQDFSWDRLPTYMGNALGDLVESLIQCLLDNPEKFAALSGILLGEKAAEEALNMLCRGLIDAALAAAIEAAAQAFLEGLAAGLSALLAALSAKGAAKKSLEDDPPGPRPDPSQPPQAPADLHAAYANAQLDFSWQQAAGADTYRAQLVAGGQVWKTQDMPYKQRQAVFDLGGIGPAPYRLQVASGKNNLWSAYNSLPVNKLGTPQQAEAACEGALIRAAWREVGGGCRYDLELHGPRVTAVHRQTATASPATVDLALDFGTGRHLLWVRAVPGGTGGPLLPSDWSGQAEFNVCTYHLAARALSHRMGGAECGRLLKGDNPAISALELAVAMARGGYQQQDTGYGLKAAWPDISPSLLAQALLKAYGGLETLEDLAARAYRQGLSGADCGKLLIGEYAQAGALAIARAMKQAGYAREQSQAGLQAALPRLSAETIRQTLDEVYC